MALVVAIPRNANASQYESQQAVKEDFGIAGVQGALTVENPKINTPGLQNDHRDYMVYVNFYTTSSAMGAGWYALNDSGSVLKYDLVYYVSPTIGTNFDLFSTLSTGTTFTPYVEQQTSSTSDCWKGTTYSSSTTHCFPTGSHPAGNAGSIARALKEYSSGANDMPGLFNVLQVGTWQSGSIAYTSFSNSNHLDEYKCFSTDKSTTTSYVLTLLASYSGPSHIDEVGSGPSLYATDDCTDSLDNQAWTAIGGT